jgi:hypothetical protein
MIIKLNPKAANTVKISKTIIILSRLWEWIRPGIFIEKSGITFADVFVFNKFGEAKNVLNADGTPAKLDNDLGATSEVKMVYDSEKDAWVVVERTPFDEG